MAVYSQIINAVWFLELFTEEFAQTDPAHRHHTHALCLVNRAFNAVFSRVLYRTVHVEEDTNDTATSLRLLQQAAGSRHLAVTTTLEIVFLGAEDTDKKRQPTNDDYIKKFRALIPDIFDKMPNLTCLHCTNYASFDDKWMRKMEEIPKLESLTLDGMFAIVQAEVIEAKNNRAENPAYFRSPSSFSALKSLKLLKMQYGIVDWSTYISSFMLHARNLEKVQLTSYNQCDDTLGDACENYAARCDDGRRVPLKTLLLGKATHTPTVRVLSKAFDLSTLETIYVSECEQGHAIVEPDVLEVCDPAVTPNLQSITVDGLALDTWRNVHKVTTGRTFFRANCAGFWHENEQGRNVYALAKLNQAPQLRLSFPRTEDDDDYGTALKSVSNCDWLTHLALWLMLDARPTSDYYARPTLEQLEAALPDLYEVLATLSQLRILQVYLASPIQPYKRVYPEHALMAAMMMAKACPTLQYINIGGTTFVARWPTRAPGSTEELEPVVSEMRMTTESAEALRFFQPGLFF